MGTIETGPCSQIDETYIKNRGMPVTWRCPHCGRRNHTGRDGTDILIRYGKYLEQCPRCGYVHIWFLKLTDDFKRGVVDMLMEGVK